MAIESLQSEASLMKCAALLYEVKVLLEQTFGKSANAVWAFENISVQANPVFLSNANDLCILRKVFASIKTSNQPDYKIVDWAHDMLVVRRFCILLFVHNCKYCKYC